MAVLRSTKRPTGFFACWGKARAAGLNIDYYPTNCVVQDGLLWYVDYECNDYSEQWDFEHWIIFRMSEGISTKP